MLLARKALLSAQYSILREPGIEGFYDGRYGITGSTNASQWDDLTGNGRHLKQATGANQPAISGTSLLFDGTAHTMATDAFTWNQPATIYLLARQVTWTAARFIMDGLSANGLRLRQGGTTPQIAFRTDGGADIASNGDWALGAYAVVAVGANPSGTDSFIQVNNNAATTGNFQSAALGGFTLGSTRTPSGFSNIQVKAAGLFSGSHDAATRRRVMWYLANIPNSGVTL